jgi:autotransporter translocation and assembly factor TamB
MRRLLAVLLVTLVIAAVVGAPRAHEELRRRLERIVAESLQARVSIAGVSGVVSSLVYGTVRVHGLRAARHGAWRVAVEEAVIEFTPRSLREYRLDITRIVLDSPRIAATDQAADALPSSEGESPITVSLGSLIVRDGRVVVAVGPPGTRTLYGADQIALDVRPVIADARWSAAVQRLSLRPRGRAIPRAQVRGAIKGRANGVVAGLDAWLERAGRVRVAGDVRLDRERARYRATISTAGLALAPLVASGPVERVRGSVVLRGRGFDGARLGYTTGLLADAPSAGRVRVGLAGHGRGALQRVRATAATDGLRARGTGTLALDAPSVDARVQAMADLATLGRRHEVALAGTTTVDATVRGPLGAPRVTATVDAVAPGYGDTRLARVTALAVVEPNPTEVRVGISRLGLVPLRGPAWTLVGSTTLTAGRTIALTPAMLASRDGQVTVGGRLGPDAALDVTLGLERLDLARLCQTLERGECSGTLAARLRFTGAGPAPRLEAVVRHSIGAEIVATGRVPFPWAAGGLPLDSVPLTLDVRSEGFDVAALQPFAGTAVVGLGGRVDLALAVTGRLRAPSVGGRLRLSDGRVEPVATRVRYRDVEALLRLEPAAIVVERLAARADGTLSGRGRVALDGVTPGAIDLSLELARLRLVSLPSYEAAATGTLAVTGEAGTPFVRGDVVIGPAVIRPAALSSSDAPIAPDPTIEVVGHSAPPVTAQRGPTLADALGLDLDVRLGDDVVVRRSDARIDLAGRVGVVKAAYQAVRARGDVRLVRGWATFQDRRFTVEPSAIRFDGAPESPTLDLTARSRAGEYEVIVQVTGRPDKPVLSLTSEPPLEESDVLAVLLFGKPARELGQGQQADLQHRALGLASTYAAGGLVRSLRNTLGLDVFDVELGEKDRPGEVRIGRYVTNDILFSIAQEFGARVGQAATIEYRVRPQVSVRASTSTSGSSGIDLFWQRRY